MKVKLSKKGVETYGRMSKRCDHAFVVDVGKNDPNCLIMLVPGYCREHGRIVMHRTMVIPYDHIENSRDLAGIEDSPQRSAYMDAVSA